MIFLAMLFVVLFENLVKTVVVLALVRIQVLVEGDVLGQFAIIVDVLLLTTRNVFATFEPLTLVRFYLRSTSEIWCRVRIRRFYKYLCQKLK